MRRKDREITDAREIARIMGLCQSVSIALAGETPYVVPVNFGFEWEEETGAFCLYIHGAAEGEKMRRMARDPRAAFAMHTGETLLGAPSACGYTMDFLSVCGSGVLEPLIGEEKRRGLTCIMAHYTPEKTFDFPEKALEGVAVSRLRVTQISGKRHETAPRREIEEER